MEANNMMKVLFVEQGQSPRHVGVLIKENKLTLIGWQRLFVNGSRSSTHYTVKMSREKAYNMLGFRPNDLGYTGTLLDGVTWRVIK